MKGYPDFQVPIRIVGQDLDKLSIDIVAQTIENLKAQTISLRGKIVDLGAIATGYIQTPYYAIGHPAGQLSQVPLAYDYVSVEGSTNSTSWKEVCYEEFELKLKRDVKVGGVSLVSIPTDIWVTGSLGHFYTRADLYRIDTENVRHHIAGWDSEQVQTSSTSPVSHNFMCVIYVDDYQLYADERLLIRVAGYAYIDDSAYEAHIKIYFDPIDRPLKAVVPWRLVDYE